MINIVVQIDSHSFLGANRMIYQMPSRFFFINYHKKVLLKISSRYDTLI